MSNIEPLPSNREALFATLMVHVRDGVRSDVNAGFVAQMLASWQTGEGGLPAGMGLTPESYDAMTVHFFSGISLRKRTDASFDWLEAMPEKAELDMLFEHYAVDTHPQRQWIASMVIAGCLGHRHLWEDLGLFSRADLTAMIAENFPALAEKNTRDMKWKKFIYKQLCEREGIIACPAPTCDACADFHVCFGSEESPSN